MALIINYSFFSLFDEFLFLIVIARIYLTRQTATQAGASWLTQACRSINHDLLSQVNSRERFKVSELIRISNKVTKINERHLIGDLIN